MTNAGSPHCRRAELLFACYVLALTLAPTLPGRTAALLQAAAIGSGLA